MNAQTKKILIWSVVGVAIIAGIILIVALFGRNKDDDSKYRDLYIQALDEKNQLLREKVDVLEMVIEEKDKAFVLQVQRDSAINSHYLENQKIYQALNAKLKDIPVRIARIASNDDSIRAAFAR
jgi:hypothetical protein